MKKLHLLFIFSWITLQLNAQTTFRESYDIASFDLSGGMVENPAGEFVFAGTNTTFIPLYGNITKLAANGNIVWSKAYVGGIATQLLDIKNVSAGNGGGYIATGGSSSGGALLLRIDDNGNIIWSKRYSLPNRPADDASVEYGNAVIETSDGGFLVGGGVDYYWDGVSGNTVDTTSAFGFKVNSTGVLQWGRVWTISVTNPDEHYISDVAESSDGYFFVGQSSEGTGTLSSNGDYPSQALVVKTDFSGTLQFIRRHGAGGTSEGFSSAIRNTAGQIVIGGFDGVNAMITSMVGTGAAPTQGAFSRRINGSAFGNTYIISDIMQNSDGNYSAVMMRIAFFPVAINTYFFKINASTNAVMIGKSYAPIGLSAILPEGGLATDQGFFATMTDQQFVGFNYNIIRTDANGDLNDPDAGCPSTTITPGTAAYTLSFTTPTSSTFTNFTESSFSPTVSNLTPVKTEHCLNVVCVAPSAPTASASPATICNGSSSTITSTAPAGVTFYYYTVPTGGTAFASGASTVVSPTTTTTYYVESDDNSNPGCKSTRTAVTVTVVQQPNAGINASTSVCSNGSAVNLFSLLTGSPDAGGTWSGGLTGGSLGTFTPGTNIAGVYTYTVASTAPCVGNDQSTVTVTVNTSPNAGTTTSTTLCSTGAAVNLFSLLGGSAQAGGTWTAGLTGGSLGTFTPGTTAPGTYTYTVTGTAPCAATSTASVTVTITNAPNAGTTTSTSLCSNGAAVNLFSLLGGSAQAGGTWTAGLTGGSLGTFTPGTTVPGTYTYTVAATAPCTGSSTANVTVTVTTAPNAGTNNSAFICTSGSAVNLFTLLGGSPQAGGTWSGPSVLTGGSLGTFTPGTNTAGNYVYSVTGTGGCSGTVTGTIAVTLTTAPNAGTTTSTSLCSNSAALNLFSLLGGSAQAGGTWSAGLTGGSLGTFTPGTSTPGTFTYTVNGTGPCAGASTAQVTVTVTSAPNAGTNNSASFCTSGSAVNLFTLLGGSPQAGGSWSGPSVLTGGSLGTFTPGTNTAGNYIYSVTGTGPCSGTVTGTISVTLTNAPNAGTTTSTSLCSNGAAVNLFSLLGGSAQAGGTWSAGLTGGSLGTFTPGTSTPGTFTYTVNGTGPCSGTSTAQVTVSVTTAPNSGTSTSTSICSSGSSTNLFTLLGGSAQSGGVWTGPSTLTGGSNGTFTPGTNTAGIYTYTVTGTGPCAGNSTATVNVTIVTAANAGTPGTLTICSNASPVNLFSSLGGTPSAGGTWSGGLTGGSLGTFTPGTNPAGTYTYTITGAAPCPNATATVVVTVNTAPATPTVNASSTTICAGQSTSITASGSGGSVFNVYDLPSGGTLLGSTPLTVSPTNTTTYYVQSVSAAGCVNSGALATVTVTVIPIDNPAWTSPGATCVPAGPINLDALITGTTGGTWSGTGVTGSTFDPTSLAGQTINITYTVGTSPCQQTSTQSISVQATISGAWTSPGTICESDGIVNLNSLITGTAGGSWTGTGVTGNTFDPTGLSGTVSITYSVGVNPCLDAVSHDIIVNSSPLDPIVTANDDTVCVGETVVITGSGSGVGTTYNIYDAPTGGNLIGTSPMTFTATATDSYYIQATNSNGCVNLGGTEEIIIVVNNNPVVDAGANVQLCPFDNTNLTATGGGNYLWSTTETTATINVAPVSNTTYYVTVTNSDGCSAMDSVTVTIYTGAGTLDAILDSTTTEENTSVITDVATNDVGNISDVTILNGPSNGTTTVNGTNIDYTPNSGFLGYDTLTYIACDAFCTSYCDTAILIIRVTEEVILTVPSGFSPNGDGLNDVFEIIGLYKFPENELFIYNRWGELVYYSKPYNNDWSGQSNNDKLKLTGDEVIDGTYFYVLKLTPDSEGMNGYIELRRR
jgi:gliding motility-associated-like protein